MYIATLNADVEPAPDDLSDPDTADPALITVRFGAAVVIEWVVPDGYPLLHGPDRVIALEEYVADKLRDLFHAQLD